MKKWMTLLLAMTLVLCTCVAASAEETGLLGGWTPAEDNAVTEAHRALLEKATKDIVGISYEPIFLLSTQVVAGTNYAFLCRGVTDQSKSYFATVSLYADLNGNAELINASEIDLNAAATPAADSQNPVMNYIGYYLDQVSQRAAMFIEAENENGAVIEINWADSAFEGYTWRLHGSCVQAGDAFLILYQDGEMLYHTSDEKNEVTYTTQYDDGEGAFLIKDDGSVIWKDLKEDAGMDCLFQWTVEE